MKIGIFGGSFNPIHVGHISLARQLLKLAGLDEVWLMVSPQNPLKAQSSLLSDQLRFEMAQLALQGEKGLVAKDYEFHLPKPSYTWNTLQHLKTDYPDCEFVLLIGGDNWALFHRWYKADDILRNYRIVIYPRRDCETDRKALPANVTVAETDLIDLSSTQIRRCIALGEPITGMVPPIIEPLVQRLYASKT
jgi:nicotinate-nucleotide adenylyltransferase